MSIAALSIDLDARLAGLQAGLDKAGMLAAKQAAQIEKAFGGASAALATMGNTLGTALSAAGIAAFVRSTVDGLDKLNDLADATGASVENLSALEDVAVRTGTSVDTMGDALVKMNKALADAKPGTDQAAAFKALGLSVEELKRIDPVQAFQKLAEALSGFANDGNKARLVQELFGKSLREVAPLLKDVAEAGKLVATVTKEQADEAERFNKQLFALQKSLTNISRLTVGPVIAGINDLIAAFERGQKAGNGFFAVINERFAQSNQSFVAKTDVAVVADLTDKIERLDAQLAINPAMDERRVGLLKLRTQLLKELQVAQAGVNAGSIYSNESRRELPPLPSVPIAPADGKTSKPGKAGKAPWDVNAWLAETQTAMDRAFIDAGEKAREADDRNRERRVQSLADMTEDLKQANLRLTAELIQDEQARARTLIILDEQVLQRKLDSLGIYGQEYEAAQAAIKEKTALALRGVDEMKQKADDTGQQLALVFTSAAGQAITQWQGFSKLLQGILADIGQIALKKVLMEPLQQALVGALSGFSFASLLGAANGRAFAAGGGVIPFASGGIVNSPTLFKFAGGTGLMGEAGPEAIMPLKRGRGGKLGVAAGGGLAPMNLTVNIDSRTDAATIAATVSRAVVAGQQQMLEYLRAQGAM